MMTVMQRLLRLRVGMPVDGGQGRWIHVRSIDLTSMEGARVEQKAPRLQKYKTWSVRAFSLSVSSAERECVCVFVCA